MRYPATSGVERPLAHPGLFALSPGDVVPVRLEAGTATLTGWRPLLDSALLLGLSLAFTASSLGRWRQIAVPREPRDEDGEPENTR